MMYKLSQFNVSVVLNEQRYIYNTLSGACIADYGEINLNSPDELFVDHQFLILSEVDEYVKYLILKTESVSQKGIRNFFIASTMNCNFSCSYCYASKSNKDMSLTTARNVISFIVDSLSPHEALGITWIGGEPLLNVDAIISVNNSILAQLGDEHFTSSVVTNGYLLTKDMAHKLLDAKLTTAVVSIDGIGSYHDLRRPLRNGGPTFCTILNNILELPSDMKTIVRMNVDDSNIDQIPLLVELLDHWGITKRAVITLVPLQPFRNENMQINDPNIIRQIRKYVEQYNCVVWGGPDPSFSPCSGLKLFDYCIDSDGFLYSCPIPLGEPEHSIGTLTQRTPTAEFYRWHALSFNMISDPCKKCCYLPLCDTNCRWLSITNLTNSSSPLNCDSIKEYYSELIAMKIGGIIR